MVTLLFWQNGHTFSCKKPSIIQSPINTAEFFGPLVTVLTGVHCIIIIIISIIIIFVIIFMLLYPFLAQGILLFAGHKWQPILQSYQWLKLNLPVKILPGYTLHVKNN